MFERILAAIDQSETADRVLAAARDLALLSHGEIWVLHVHEREASKFVVAPLETGEDAQEMVRAAASQLAEAGLTVHTELKDTIYGHAAREIIDAAKAHDSGVIVMGSRGHGNLAGLLVGSTAHKVIHLSDRPVLVVR